MSIQEDIIKARDLTDLPDWNPFAGHPNSGDSQPSWTRHTFDTKNGDEEIMAIDICVQALERVLKLDKQGKEQISNVVEYLHTRYSMNL